MTVSVELNTPLAEALNNVVQPKLVEVGWSTGGGDDSALAEYIILMLVNRKTQEQIAAELANDLLGLGPDDTEAVDFSKWLFEQVETLNRQLNGGGDGDGGGGGGGEEAAAAAAGQQEQQGQQQGAAQAIPSLPESHQRHGDGSTAQAPDMNMGEAGPTIKENLPTGPRTMRNQRQNGRGRLLNQISRHMDRSNESVIHRVRNQGGSGRIDTHNRDPPRGPRAFQHRNGRSQAGRNMAAMGMAGGMGMGNNPMQNAQGGGIVMTPQQQMQLMQMFEEQARMMAQFMPGLVPPAINPAFQQNNQQQGRSLFERAEYQPQRNQFQRRGPHHHFGKPAQQPESKEVEMGEDEKADQSPDQGQQQQQHGESTERGGFDSLCRYNLRCTNKDCPYAHQSPVAPEGIAVDLSDTCPFGAACKNRKCVARHPSPAVKASHQAEELCKYFPHCANPHCPFKHPDMPLCRNGADCSVPGCKFTHLQTPCKFHPCLNRMCPYKHVEGQKGIFTDKVWRASDANRPHVSERKFTTDDGEEELIKPGSGVVEAVQNDAPNEQKNDDPESHATATATATAAT
ncbi:hypothetical protein VTO42DRAFT_1496 [Malbranchea cinnamomea]